MRSNLWLRDIRHDFGKCGWILAVGLSLASCGTGAGPSSTALTGIMPASGTTLGGTRVTITGTMFSAGDVVTIGGTPATNLSMVNSTTITITTPQHAAGPVDVAVSAPGGQQAILPAAYTYVAPAPTSNAPPVIGSIVVQGRVGPREPPGFASLDETVAVSATVTDVDTPVSQLAFGWSADTGTFNGSGPNVTWTAPHTFATPGTVLLTLSVSERSPAPNDPSAPSTGGNAVSRAVPVRLHDSLREIGDLATDFLVGFSKQLDAAYVVRNFASDCAGAAAELSDVQKDNQQFTITSYTIGTPLTTIVFTGAAGCPFRGVFGDACAQVPVEWHSTNKLTNTAGVAKGIDQVTAVLENDQWVLCASDFNSSAVSAAMLAFRTHR
jgi:hypothetical protein